MAVEGIGDDRTAPSGRNAVEDGRERLSCSARNANLVRRGRKLRTGVAGGRSRRRRSPIRQATSRTWWPRRLIKPEGFANGGPSSSTAAPPDDNSLDSAILAHRINGPRRQSPVSSLQHPTPWLTWPLGSAGTISMTMARPFIFGLLWRTALLHPDQRGLMAAPACNASSVFPADVEMHIGGRRRGEALVSQPGAGVELEKRSLPASAETALG
jgi:hypothetical protein